MRMSAADQYVPPSGTFQLNTEPSTNGTPFGAYGTVRYTRTGKNCSFACASAAPLTVAAATIAAHSRPVLAFVSMYILLSRPPVATVHHSSVSAGTATAAAFPC